MGGSDSRMCSGPEINEVDARYRIKLAEVPSLLRLSPICSATSVYNRSDFRIQFSV